MKKKITTFAIEDKIFGYNLFLVCGGEERDAYNKWKKHLLKYRIKLEVEFPEERPAFARFHMLYKSAAGMVWFENYKPGTRAVTHEMLHVTFEVMKRKGIPLADASEEAFCYYTEWLVSEFGDRMWWRKK